MSGIHVAYRKSTGKNFNQVESTIVLPTNCTYRANRAVTVGGTVKYYDGAFPEFFHGFYQGSTYGLDIGILYQAGVYKLFFYCYANVASQVDSSGNKITWYTSSKSFVPASSSTIDRTFTLKSHFENGYLVTRCRNSSGATVASLDVYLNPTAYTAMNNNGCTINRELCLAINKNEKGTCTFPAGVSFTNTKFTKTKMTTVNGTIIEMTASNTTTNHNKRDTGCEIAITQPYYNGNTVPTTENGYIADTAYASV